MVEYNKLYQYNKSIIFMEKNGTSSISMIKKTHKGKIIPHKGQYQPRDSGGLIITYRKDVAGLTEQSETS